MKAPLILMVVASRMLIAQATVTVRGIAYDSLHQRPLAGAFVAIKGTTVSAFSDSAGRFSISGVAPGALTFVLQHDVLDALGISAATTRAVVTDGRAPVTVAVPSFTQLWSAVCADPPRDKEHGLLFGNVRGRKDGSERNTTVSATWIELTIQTGKTVEQKQKAVETNVDSTGGYAFCGVPANTMLQIRAAAGTSESGVVDVLPFLADRIARRDLTLGAPLDSVVKAKRGGTLMGKVLDSSRAPIVGTQVLIPALGAGTETDRDGSFRIADLTPGTFLVSIRKIGYAPLDERLEFAEATTTSYTASLAKVVTLDSVSVTAKSPRDEAMRLFDENRKLGLGKFVTRDQLEQLRELKLVDIIGQFPGLRPERGNGGQGYVLSNRGIKSILESCEAPKQDSPQAEADATKRRLAGAAPLPRCTTSCFAHVFLDGVDLSPAEVPNLNRINPSDLEAVEYYAGGASVPAEYNRLNASRCGLIVLHTRRGPDRRRP